MHINEITVRILIGNRSGIHQRNVLMGRLQLRCIFSMTLLVLPMQGSTSKITQCDTNVRTSLTFCWGNPFLCPNDGTGEICFYLELTLISQDGWEVLCNAVFLWLQSDSWRSALHVGRCWDGAGADGLPVNPCITVGMTFPVFSLFIPTASSSWCASHWRLSLCCPSW